MVSYYFLENMWNKSELLLCLVIFQVAEENYLTKMWQSYQFMISLHHASDSLHPTIWFIITVRFLWIK